MIAVFTWIRAQLDFLGERDRAESRGCNKSKRVIIKADVRVIYVRGIAATWVFTKSINCYMILGA